MARSRFFGNSSKKFKVIFQRATLAFLCSVLVFTAAAPNNVMALSLFGQKPVASILPGGKLDIKKTQAIGDTPIPAPEATKPKVDHTLDHELTSKRTPFSSTFVNKDGSKTLKMSVNQQNFKDGNSWQRIDNSLQAVEAPAPARSLMDMITGTAPKSDPPSQFKGKAGTIDATMNSLADGMQITAGGKTFTMKPVGARNVKPEHQDDHSVIYKDAWPNADLVYELRGETVKETIVLKNKSAQTTFDFKIDGGKVITHPTRAGELTIEGLPEEFSFAPVTLDVHDRGVISEHHVTQAATKNGIRVAMDDAWLHAQPASAFPMHIDPTIGKDTTSYWMFKSDGYSCGASNCYANIGAILDGSWKNWRTYINFPYNELAGKNVLYASVHGYFKYGMNGITDPHAIYMGHAPCINYNCQGQVWGSTTASTDFDIDFTNGLKQAVTAGDYSAVWSLWGEESAYKSYKPYYDMYATIVYDTPTPVPTQVDPADKQVVVGTQPTFRTNPVSDADGPVQYSFTVSTNNDGSGAVINSGWTSATQWTVPDGVLQDGTTYYWRVQAKDTTPSSQPSASAFRSFKVDFRTGKDSTQAYDTVGPIGVDLATGNATTSTGTHTMNALGGKIGLNFDYDSPATAKKGLIGEYWNVAANYDFNQGAPTSSAQVTRNDQDVNFNWPNGSSPAGGINTDWFYARWKGYFVAPTTGNYSFGASQDDALSINVGGQTFSGCYGSTPCYNGAPIALQAGQAVPITVAYEEATGDAYVHMYVKGAVPEQTVPSEWLRTAVQPSVSQYGLSGRYYTDDGSHSFPNDPYDANRFMMARSDSKLSFNWGLGGPASGLQSDNFMARWTGYVTVPSDGSYTFGAVSDDGVRVKLNNGALGSQQTVLDSWQDQAATVWGSAQSLTGGQQIPITVEYYEHGGGAQMSLLVKGPGLDTNGEEIPVKWLTPKASALPDAWRLGVDVDGNVGYERLRIAGQNVILEDSTRATHEYTWTGSGFKPPVNEDGQLTRNNDNTYTLLDTDGRTYVFDAEGKLKLLSSPVDDRNPASLRYVYGGDPSRLLYIVDGTTIAANAQIKNDSDLANSRYGKLIYKGINEDSTTSCSTPSGFSDAPVGMLCAFRTTDGDVTRLDYNSGQQLSRIEKPGGENTDYGYDNNPDPTTNLGRIVSIRDSLANDTITAGVRADDSSLKTELAYDNIGRVSNIVAPAATAGANRTSHTFDYSPSALGQAQAAQAIGATAASTPVAISWGGDRIDLFARGTGSDLIHKWYDNGVWSNWESLGGCMQDNPSVASWGYGRLDILIRGCNTSGSNLYHKWYDLASGWHDYELLSMWGSTQISGSPSITSWGDQRLDFTARRASDGVLMLGYWAPGANWQGAATSDCVNDSPSITSSGSNRLEVYSIACNASGDNVQLRTWNSYSWSGQAIVPGLRAQSVYAAKFGSAGVGVIARQDTGNIQLREFGASNWRDMAICSTGIPTASSHANADKIFYQPCGGTDISQMLLTINQGASQMHIAGAPEPNGFSKRVEYDSLLRTTRETDVANLSSLTEWDSVKDLELSKTDATGLRSTTIYDDDDRAIESYGPAPSAWYGTDRRPQATYASQVPKTTTGYDEGMTGLAVTYMASNAAQPTNILYNGQVMAKGDSRTSYDGRFRFTYQTDGNIVLYGPSGPLWSSNTTNQASTMLGMQSDGNLVLYNGGTPIWATNTGGSGSTTILNVQNDGNVVLYNSSGSRWATNTGGWAPSSTPATATLTGTPQLRTTNIATDGTISKNFGTTSPIPNQTGAWGMTMTGKMRLPTTGNWNFRIASDNGVRVWIDDVLVQDDWFNADVHSHPTFSYNNTVANSMHRVRIMYYHTSGTASFTLYATPPGDSETANTAQYFSPDYSLKTIQTTYDAQLGDVTSTTTYNTPEYGLANKTTVDPTGLNLQTSSTYEAPGTGFLRQTSKTLPGGSTTTYQHYDGTEPRANPCDANSTPVIQAGLPKGKTEADPDGAGPQTGRTSEAVYNASGEVVATRYNNDPWTCKTYDVRGRIASTVIPQLGQYQPARTITNNYSVNGNPLVTSTSDSTGTVTVENDLLGRTVKYTDVHGDVTTSTYDDYGKLTQRVGPIGTETFAYDQYDRLTDQKLDGITYAHVTYDQYGRIDNVTYPAAGQQKVQYARDSLGRTSGLTYTVASATAPGPNLVANSSLEQASGSPATPTNWTQGSWGTNTSNLTYENTGHSGTQSVKTEITSFTDGDAKWMFNPVSVTGNTKYTYTDFFKSNVWTNVVVQYTHQDNSVTWGYLGGNDSSNSWAQGTFSFTTPADISKVSVGRLMDRVGWVQLDDVDLHQAAVPSGTTTIADTVTRATSGDILSGTENGVAKSYTYDKAGRLTGATLGSNTYTYEFGTPDTSCNGLAGNNPNAAKDSNRTRSTVNGQATTYCYDMADRLISSSDPSFSNVQYDAHGNTTRLNATLRPLYDASDRSRGIEEYDDATGNGHAVYYERDAQDRITARYEDNIVNWNWQASGARLYGFTGAGDTPDFTKDTNGNVLEKYVTLPGDVLITIRTQPGATQKTYSLPNIHGDIFATTDDSAIPLSTTMTGPFGETITGQKAPNNTTQDTTFSYVGQHEKVTEASFTTPLIQMGARIYAPGLGRFLSVDPQEGGSDNNYAYVNDPVNESDLTGQAWWNDAWKFVGKHADEIGLGVAAVGFGVCVVATAGACGIAAGIAAAASAGLAAAQVRYNGGSWGKAVGAAVVSGATDFAMGKVKFGEKTVRNFGKVAPKYYGTVKKALSSRGALTALSTRAGRVRALKFTTKAVGSYFVGQYTQYGYGKVTRRYR